MQIFLSESLYKHIQQVDPIGWQSVLDKFSVLGEKTDLTFFYTPVERDAIALVEEIMDYYKNYITTISLPEHLDIIKEIRTEFAVTDNAVSPDQFISNLQTRIDALPDGIDKTQCQIYLLKYKIETLNSQFTFFNSELFNLKKQIIDIYNADTTKDFDEDILSVIHYLITEQFIAAHVDTYVHTADEALNLYNELMSKFTSIEAVMDAKYPNEYMKNLKAYEKIYALKTFYSKFVINLNADEFLKADDWYNRNMEAVCAEFKYGDLTWFTLEYMQDRLLAYFGHSYLNKGFELIDELGELLTNKFSDKNALGRPFHYRGTFYTGKFLCLISYLKQFESSYLNNLEQYTRKNQFTDLPLIQREEVAMRLAVSRGHATPNWTVIKNKLEG
jgi:hypothetical protein